MAKTVKLLLTENVDNLGIVGDVVGVRLGYARNYLLPRGLATQPSDEAIAAVAAKRAEAERQLAVLRKEREGAVEKLNGQEVSIQRSCNDQGILYGAVTQQDIADALAEQGFAVRAREVRLGQTIKRIDAYDVQIKFDSDLSAMIKVWVVADRRIEAEDDREEMDFDNEGNLIEKPKKGKGEKNAESSEDSAEEPRSSRAGRGRGEGRKSRGE